LTTPFVKLINKRLSKQMTGFSVFAPQGHFLASLTESVVSSKKINE
jgi:hypothetical protein